MRKTAVNHRLTTVYSCYMAEWTGGAHGGQKSLQIKQLELLSHSEISFGVDHSHGCVNGPPMYHQMDHQMDHRATRFRDSNPRPIRDSNQGLIRAARAMATGSGLASSTGACTTKGCAAKARSLR